MHVKIASQAGLSEEAQGRMKKWEEVLKENYKVSVNEMYLYHGDLQRLKANTEADRRQAQGHGFV